MGMPYYAPDRNDPQKTVFKLTQFFDDYIIDVTGSPGRPQPNVRSSIRVMALNKTSRRPNPAPMVIDVLRVKLFGAKEALPGITPERAPDGAYIFHPTYPAAGTYELILYLDARTKIDGLHIPLAVGETGSPWLTLAIYLAALLLFIIGIRIMRKRRAAA